MREIVQEWISSKVLAGSKARFKRSHSIANRQHAFQLMQDQMLNLACNPNQLSMGTFNEIVKALFRPAPGSSSSEDQQLSLIQKIESEIYPTFVEHLKGRIEKQLETYYNNSQSKQQQGGQPLKMLIMLWVEVQRVLLLKEAAPD